MRAKGSSTQHAISYTILPIITNQLPGLRGDCMWTRVKKWMDFWGRVYTRASPPDQSLTATVIAGDVLAPYRPLTFHRARGQTLDQLTLENEDHDDDRHSGGNGGGGGQGDMPRIFARGIFGNGDG